MSEEKVLRMIAEARDKASGPMRKVENALRGVGRAGKEESKALRDNLRLVHDQFKKVADVGKTAVSPAIDAIGVSSLTAVGAVAALVGGLKNFVDQGTDVAAFGRKVMLTTNTIRGLEGVADKFHVDPSEIRQGEKAFVDAMFEIRRHHGATFAALNAKDLNLAQQLAATPETVAGNEQALKSVLKMLEQVKRVHGAPDARMWSREIFGNEAFVDLLRDGNAGLDQLVKTYLRLAGAQNDAAGQAWINNWSDFKATIEGVRNEVGNDLLPDITKLAVQVKEFFAANRVEIGRDIADTFRQIGTALREVNSGVQAIGGWKPVFEGLIALKLVGLAANVTKVALALGRLAHIGTPAAWILRLLGLSVGTVAGATGSLAAAVLLSSTAPAGESDAAEKARRDADMAANGGARTGGRTSSGVMYPSFDAAVGGFGKRAADIIQGLRDRGLDPEHAAILGGNIERESGFDPTKPNVAEGGIGLIQWRLERRAALQALAAKRHTLETDAGTQLDFLMQEIQSTPQGRAFIASRSPEDMNRALHGFIRYGDASENTRLAYGRSLLPLAEKTQPGSLLAAAGRAGMGGAAGTVTGSATLDVTVAAPRGTTVKASADGLFDRVKVDRGAVMPDASGGD
jgi:hypothetical protein